MNIPQLDRRVWFGLAVIALAVLLGVIPAPHSTPAATAPPAALPTTLPTPPPTPPPTPTPPPSAATASPAAAASFGASPAATPGSIGAFIKEQVGAINDAALGAFLAIATLILFIPIGAILLLRLWARITWLLRRQQLVLEDLIDATGDDGIKNTLAGLSQGLRHDLYLAAAATYEEVQRTRAAHTANQLIDAPPPRKAADSGIAELITAIKDAAPGETKIILALLGALFPPNGRKVASTLQLVGSPPRGLAMAAEISDLSSPDRTIPASFRGALLAHSAPATLPAGSNLEATGLASVGLAYEAASSWEDAKTKYGEALTKEPAYAAAREGLSRVLGVPEPRVRAERFIPPAARWLSLLLFESEWLRRDEHGEGGTIAEEHARIHNFVGNALTNLAAVPGVDAADASAQAIVEFEAARKAHPKWFVPYKNEADAVSYLAALTGEPARQFDALSLYDLALERAAADDGYLSDQMPAALARSDMLTEVAIDRGIARLLAGDLVGSQEDVSNALGADWQPETEENPNILYAIACYYGRLFEQHSDQARGAIQRFVPALVFAFLRDPNLVREAALDPDLEPLRDVVVAIATARDWRAASPGDIDADVLVGLTAIAEMIAFA